MPTTNPIQRVGFIGLGNMGGPMAGHLAHAGFEMTVADISPGVASKFVARNGGKVAASLSSLGSTVEAVITMLPTGLVVRDVLVGGVLESLAPGSIVIDMSTSNPFDTRVTVEKNEAHGVSMIDCAAAGGVVFAQDATLSITAGGDADVLSRCRPLLDTMANKVIHCGGIGAGHAMKVLNNFINANALITAFEALSLGKRFGLETETMLKTMTAAATGRNNPIDKKVRPLVADSNFTTGMALAFLAKDVRIAAEMAENLESFAPIAKQCADLWADAADRFGPTHDQIEVARLWLNDK